jgi:hypothetical protein
MRCAVFRFKGSRSVAAAEAARKRLDDWVWAKGLRPSGPYRFAYYDPPWMPEFLTRNEVLVPVGK